MQGVHGILGRECPSTNCVEIRLLIYLHDTSLNTLVMRWKAARICEVLFPRCVTAIYFEVETIIVTVDDKIESDFNYKWFAFSVIL